MKRDEILRTAERHVCLSRQNEYGSPKDNFDVVAALWSDYLQSVKVSATDVAAMMCLVKIARIRTGAPKADNWVDIAGYAACGGEIEEETV